MELKDILKITQSELLSRLPEYLKIKGYSESAITANNSYIYSMGELPVLMVAHLDTVLDVLPSDETIIEEGDIIYSPRTGLGADDRAGVYGVLQLLEYKPHVLFTTEEEHGRAGAQKAVKGIACPNIKFVIELDRRGNNDCVFYGCTNKSFIEYIEGFGFNYSVGTYSDISTLCPAWDIAGVNLSTGYYNAHRLSEHLNISEMNNTIQRVKGILENLPRINKYPYSNIRNVS